MQRHHHHHYLADFRTPQHPSAGGTNSWGGASPLLARDIPKESLDQRYSRLNTIRNRDQIFNTQHYDHLVNLGQQETTTANLKHVQRTGLLWKLRMIRSRDANKERKTPVTATLGGNGKKMRWLPRWDPQNRWPQGWC